MRIHKHGYVWPYAYSMCMCICIYIYMSMKKYNIYIYTCYKLCVCERVHDSLYHSLLVSLCYVSMCNIDSIHTHIRIPIQSYTYASKQTQTRKCKLSSYMCLPLSVPFSFWAPKCYHGRGSLLDSALPLARPARSGLAVDSLPAKAGLGFRV